MAIAVFCNEVKGKSMLALSRELDVQYKTAFVLAHKLREAMRPARRPCVSAVRGGFRDRRRLFGQSCPAGEPNRRPARSADRQQVGLQSLMLQYTVPLKRTA